MILDNNMKVDFTGVVRELEKDKWFFQTDSGKLLSHDISVAIDEILVESGYEISKDFDRYKITVEKI